MASDINSLIDSIAEAEDNNQLPDKIALRSLYSEASSNQNLLSPYTRQYQRTLVKRLTWLKYLDAYPEEIQEETHVPHVKNTTPKPIFTETSFKKIKNAVKAFQKEAAIKEDGWAGPDTWKTLEQLVSFENDQDCLKWEKASSLCDLNTVEDQDLINPAMARAICLRLQSMGFLDDWSGLLEDCKVRKTPMCSVENINQALRKYNQFTSLIGFTTNPWPIKGEEDVLNPKESDSFITHGVKDVNSLRIQEKSICWRLFRQDSLVQKLGQHKRKLNSIYENKNFKRIIRRIARIELWLNGFDIDFTEDQEFIVKKARREYKKVSGTIKRIDIPEVTKTDLAIQDFWDLAHKNKKNTHGSVKQAKIKKMDKAKKSGINRYIFELFAQFSNENGSIEIDAEWDQFISEETDDSQRVKIRSELEREIVNLGSRIWDGVKRAANWLRSKASRVLNWFKKGSRKASLAIKNAARFIAGKSRAAYRYVSAAFSIVGASFKQLENNSYGGITGYSTAGVAYFVSDMDFDQKVLVNSNATSEQINHAIEKLRAWTQIYTAGARIFGALGKIFFSIFNAITRPVIGWLSGLYTLAKLYKVIKSMVSEVQRIESLLVNRSQFQDMYEWIFLPVKKKEPA